MSAWTMKCIGAQQPAHLLRSSNGILANPPEGERKPCHIWMQSEQISQFSYSNRVYGTHRDVGGIRNGRAPGTSSVAGSLLERYWQLHVNAHGV